MIKNPFISAGLAVLYIVVIVSVLQYTQTLAKEPDTIFAPIAMISLFTLSAAVMGYLFLSQPIQLFLSGEKKQAVEFFLKTLGIFTLATIIIWFFLFLGL